MSEIFMSFHALVLPFLLASRPQTLPASDPGVVYSPYNWYRSGDTYAQSPNPGAYLKLGFSGAQLGVGIDVSPLVEAKVPAEQYPVIRYSVDGRPATTLQLKPETRSIPCAAGLPSGSHQLLLQYVAGYVFLDFWTPVDVLRVTGFTVDEGAAILSPSTFSARQSRTALFFGDSITNGDDDIATFASGITNAVDTQDATEGYPSIVASALGAEYGLVAYGGASWDHHAADGHTPGLMTFYSMLDDVHSRLVGGKFSPVPDDIFVNMGENSPPSGDDVPKLLGELRSAGGSETNIWIIVPFSGRARKELTAGVDAYQKTARDPHTYVIDLGNNPYLGSGRSMFSVDGQHPLASQHAILAAQLVAARAMRLSGR
ncbi:MAG TPA: hypothetical protein VHE55_17640 [Fimbriimonadaceae bacterium]|nr:hypothetical protein [Fimbriimonadaceae bacterium]